MQQQAHARAVLGVRRVQRGQQQRIADLQHPAGQRGAVDVLRVETVVRAAEVKERAAVRARLLIHVRERRLSPAQHAARIDAVLRQMPENEIALAVLADGPADRDGHLRREPLQDDCAVARAARGAACAVNRRQLASPGQAVNPADAVHDQIAGIGDSLAHHCPPPEKMRRMRSTSSRMAAVAAMAASWKYRPCG